MRRLLVVAAALGLALLLPAAPGLGAERRKPPETKRVQTVSKAVYEKLNSAMADLQEERFEPALTKLQALLKRKKLNDHELALIHQTRGYVYSGKEQYSRAIQDFEKAVALDALPDTSGLHTQFNLGQLYLLNERTDEGIATLLVWFERAQNPGASAYMLLANAYAQKEDFAKALEWAERGLAKEPKPQIAWMRLAASLNLSAERYARAAHWLEHVVAIDPKKKSDWMQLVAVYGQQEQARKALAALQAAELQGFVASSDERVRLAQLYLFNGIPYKAGVLLEQGLDAGAIEKTGDTWELLANAWSLAREDDRAIEPLRRAAELRGEGKLWLRLGQLHADAERWEPAQSALRKALSRGGLEDAGEARLLLGIAFFEGGDLDAARSAFRQAAAQGQAKAARAWLQVLESRVATGV